MAVAFVLASIFLVVLGTIDSPVDTVIGVGITLTGIPFYFLMMYHKRLPRWLTRLEGLCSLMPITS